MIGKRILHYKITEKLGEGGMGVVYKAEDTKLERTVAIKFLPRQISVNDRERERFFIEAKAAAALNHPNISTIHAIEETDLDAEHGGNQLFIVMEYIDGRDLREVIGTASTEKTTLPVEKILNFAIQIVSGLQAAHEKGIVHRDIKSSNIMISSADQEQAKIMDFGLAKVQGGPLVTAAETTLGTAAYMAPEQARGEDVDPRADIWSFGIVLYEMVTGNLPFRGEYEQAVLYSIVNESHQSASEITQNIPAKLEKIINRCLEKNRETRYQTSIELLDDLLETSENLGLISSHTLKKQRRRSGKSPARWAGRRTLVISAAALLLLILLTALPITRSILIDLVRFGHANPEKHLLVLPFTNISGERSQQALCDGLAETLTSKLSQLEQFHGSLWVVPMSEVLRNKIGSPGEARKFFGANLAITGSLQLIKKAFRLTLNLVDANTLRQINSSIIDFGKDDIASLQDAAISNVLNMLNLELNKKSQNLVKAGGTKVANAYELYLKGRGYLQYYENGENLNKAVFLFTEATEKDSLYALAYAGLGEAFWRKYNAVKDIHFIQKASQASEKAFLLDSNLTAVNITRGNVHFTAGKYKEAVRDFNRALNRDATNADAYRGLAKTYDKLGRKKEAEQIYQRAILLKPDYWAGYSDLGMFYFRHSKFQQAQTQFREVTRLTPDNAAAYNKLAGSYYMLEQWTQARKTFEKALALKKSYRIYSNLGTLNYIEGHYAEAARMYEQALKLNDRSFTTWGNMAAAYQWAPGKQDKAKAAYWRAIGMAEETKKINPRDSDVISQLAGYYASVGEREKALQNLKASLKLAADDFRVMYRTGTTYELLGEREKALNWIGKALQNGYTRGEIERQPELREFLADSRYQKIIKNLTKKPE